MPFIPKHYRLKGLPNTAKQFAVIKGLFNKSDLIINATDWDREGEAIFSYIYEKAECKTPYKRAYYHSMTEEDFTMLSITSKIRRTRNPAKAPADAGLSPTGLSVLIAQSQQHCIRTLIPL